VKLSNSLTIPVPPADAWQVLLDLPRIAPCVPGATLTSQDGDVYGGRVKVKLGPIGLSYSGTVNFVSQDASGLVAVLEASGRETRGSGTAKALVTCRLVGAGDATDVLIETDLAITGKPAQFGRGALAEVTTALIAQFADNLAAELAASPTPAEPAAPAAPAAESPAAAGGAADGMVSGRVESPPVELLGALGGGMGKRVGPLAVVAATVLFLLVVGRRIRRRRAS
jgi:carbon monoxide dehydrogenase subunit G